MEIIEWLNENELRSYPLVSSTPTGVPDNLLLDLQLKVNPGNETTASLTDVIMLNGGVLRVTFTDNIFDIPADVTAFPYYARNSNNSLCVFGEGVLPIREQSNFHSIVSCPVEPSTVHSFSGAWLGVSSLNGNPRYSTISDSYSPILPLESISGAGAVGDVEFKDGYNYRIDFKNNVINMTAAFGLGLQMTCATHFIDPASLDCDKIVSYINGVPPNSDGVFTFTAGTNIYLFDGATVDSPILDSSLSPTFSGYTDLDGNFHAGLNPNTVFVGLTFATTDLCSPVQLLPTNN